jgi:undecaprenyl diphosphate synthase
MPRTDPDRASPARSDPERPFPRNIAIIMDGNGRWAQERRMRRILGHREGIRSVREITTECARRGVESLTLYSFSVENWKRPRAEVRYLMGLLAKFLVQERPTLMDNGVRLRAIGRLADLPSAALGALRETEALTASNPGMLLRLALSYGSRSEIADAIAAIARDVSSGALDPASVDEETLRGYLYDPDTADPDLLIRTAGEMRLSNFLLWQISYSELYVSSVCWPEFRKAQLEEAFDAYASRQRKFGGLISDAAPEGTSGPSPRPAPAAPGTSTRRSPERPPSAGPPDRPATGSGRSAPAKRPR